MVEGEKGPSAHFFVFRSRPRWISRRRRKRGGRGEVSSRKEVWWVQRVPEIAREQLITGVWVGGAGGSRWEIS